MAECDAAYPIADESPPGKNVAAADGIAPPAEPSPPKRTPDSATARARRKSNDGSGGLTWSNILPKRNSDKNVVRVKPPLISAKTQALLEKEIGRHPTDERVTQLDVLDTVIGKVRADRTATKATRKNYLYRRLLAAVCALLCIILIGNAALTAAIVFLAKVWKHFDPAVLAQPMPAGC